MSHISRPALLLCSLLVLSLHLPFSVSSLVCPVTFSVSLPIHPPYSRKLFAFSLSYCVSASVASCRGPVFPDGGLPVWGIPGTSEAHGGKGLVRESSIRQAKTGGMHY